MKGFKITNLIMNILMFLYAFAFTGLVGGFSLLEIFVGSWGRNEEAVSEAVVLFFSSAVIILHGFLALIFGIVAFAAWRKKPKPYLITHLSLSISGIIGMGGLCLLYRLYSTGACDVMVLDNRLLRGEYLFLMYVALCVIELLLAVIAYASGSERTIV
ncbi:MAG: hypothetical protein J5636_05950 [Clostridiales bacterium]|nr:hypothetical protein [Clostridiales bacterium]